MRSTAPAYRAGPLARRPLSVASTVVGETVTGFQFSSTVGDLLQNVVCTGYAAVGDAAGFLAPIPCLLASIS